MWIVLGIFSAGLLLGGGIGAVVTAKLAASRMGEDGDEAEPEAEG